MAFQFQLLFSTPFTPRKNFKNLTPEFKGAFWSLILSVLIISAVYSFFYVNNNRQQSSETTFHLLGYAIGLFAKNIFVAYLLMVFSRRSNEIQLNWSETFTCVAYALLPLVVGVIWEGAFPESTFLGSAISFLWNALIITIGLIAIKKINFWKASGLVFGILIIIRVVLTVFVGIEV